MQGASTAEVRLQEPHAQPHSGIGPDGEALAYKAGDDRGFQQLPANNWPASSKKPLLGEWTVTPCSRYMQG